ncbi:hypothetical protein F4806DRAFT_494940 [Annulohypoxylon nitens]|nr:hypothetical protein F4806DRAFT_494940 [Annulohypoxylon nitens]
MSYSPVVYPNAATMSSSAVQHPTYLPDDGTMDDGTMDDGTMDDGTMDDGTMDDGTMDDGHYMDVEEPLSTAATYQNPGAAAKPSYEELEHAYNLLHKEASVEISRLTEAYEAQKVVVDKAKKYLKGAMADRQRLHIENRRLKVKMSKLQEPIQESGDPMVLDMDGDAEVKSANDKAMITELEDYIGNLQHEYMVLVEKSEEQQKAAAKDATSRVVAVKLQMAKEAMVLKKEADDRQKKIEDLDQEVKGLKREVRGLREKDRSQYRRFQERTLKRCQQDYDDCCEQLFQSYHPPTPSPSPPASGSSLATNPITPSSLRPALLSSPLPDGPQTPPTPTPMGKMIRVKEFASMEGALSLAHQAHEGVRESAIATLQQHGVVKGGIKYLNPEVSLETAYQEHARVRESAVNKLRELEEMPVHLKDVLGQRGYQRRTQQRVAKKEEAQMMKGAKPKRLSRQ